MVIRNKVSLIYDDEGSSVMMYSVQRQQWAYCFMREDWCQEDCKGSGKDELVCLMSIEKSGSDS
jgi:hypothetical protein